MMLYRSGWNCSPLWGTVLDIYKTLSCKSFIQKKKKKIPTYLPTSKMMGRSTANIQFFKDGPTNLISPMLSHPGLDKNHVYLMHWLYRKSRINVVK